jgi:hypothetical protein
MTMQKPKLPSNTMTKMINELDAAAPLWYDFFKVIALNFQELIDDSGALKLPVFNDSNRPIAGIAGRVIYNSTTNTIQVDNGSSWNSL